MIAKASMLFAITAFILLVVVFCSHRPKEDFSKMKFSKTPITLKLNVPAIPSSCSDSFLALQQERLFPDKQATLSVAAHFVLNSWRLRGQRPFATENEVNKMLYVFLDSEQMASNFGSGNALQQTPYGWRFLTPLTSSPIGQAHPDQVLSMLAECGVDSTRSIKHPYEEIRLSNLIEDCAARFRIENSEIAWSTLVMLLYYPNEQGWTNRFGEHLDYNMIAGNLMQRDTNSASCFGGHIYYALAAMLQVNKDYSIIDEKTQHNIVVFLQTAATEILNHYTADMFRNCLQDDGDGASILLALSHHLNWMFLLDAEFHPEEDYLEAVSAFMVSYLGKVSDQEIRNRYCPFSHTLNILGILRYHEVVSH